MNQHRSLLACLVTLALCVLGLPVWGSGCASGGSASATATDDGGPGDGTTPMTDASGEGGDAGGCAGGRTRCGGACTSTGTDPKNCGACGVACSATQVCSQGMCAAGCSGGETLCGGISPDAGAPESGSGSPDGSASSGQDAATPIDAGASSGGDGGAAAPYCAGLSNDPNNCGACGNSCGTNGVCTSGTCTLVCPSGQKGCPASGTCIPDNTCCQSGECTITGEVCPMPGGTCACPAGERECAGSLMSCISNSACCTNADCTLSGQMCTTPGQPCGCTKQCCVPSDCPNEPNVTSDACSPTNTCEITACTAGCYDLDGKFSDGCECCDDVYGKSCATATAGGGLSVGAKVVYTGIIGQPTGGDWFSVTFSGETNIAFHALVQLTTGGGEFVFDVVQGACVGAPITCGAEGGNATGRTTWETSYAGPNPAADPASVSPTGASNFQPIAAVGTVFVHVYRANASGAATCNPFTLTISE